MNWRRCKQFRNLIRTKLVCGREGGAWLSGRNRRLAARQNWPKSGNLANPSFATNSTGGAEQICETFKQLNLTQRKRHCWCCSRRPKKCWFLFNKHHHQNPLYDIWTRLAIPDDNYDKDDGDYVQSAIFSASPAVKSEGVVSLHWTWRHLSHIQSRPSHQDSCEGTSKLSIFMTKMPFLFFVTKYVLSLKCCNKNAVLRIFAIKEQRFQRLFLSTLRLAIWYCDSQMFNFLVSFLLVSLILAPPDVFETLPTSLWVGVQTNWGKKGFGWGPSPSYLASSPSSPLQDRSSSLHVGHQSPPYRQLMTPASLDLMEINHDAYLSIAYKKFPRGPSKPLGLNFGGFFWAPTSSGLEIPGWEYVTTFGTSCSEKQISFLLKICKSHVFSTLKIRCWACLALIWI